MNTNPKEGKNRDVRVSILLPAWLREQLDKAAEKEGMARSTWISLMLRKHCLDTLEIPQPPPAVNPIPSTSDVLRSYVDGSFKLIGPCGERWPCEYENSESDFIVDYEFCGHCGVRVN